jgi:hypothetical protein
MSYAYFWYAHWTAPTIHGVVPIAAAPGDQVTLYGDFKWYMLDFERFSPQEPRGFVRQIEIGGFRFAPPAALPFLVQACTQRTVTCMVSGETCIVSGLAWDYTLVWCFTGAICPGQMIPTRQSTKISCLRYPVHYLLTRLQGTITPLWCCQTNLAGQFQGACPLGSLSWGGNLSTPSPPFGSPLLPP